MATRFWTCTRQAGGVKCATKNPARLQKCSSCGKRRPPRKKPAHMAAMETFDYATWAARYGEFCAICGIAPKPGRRLHRDHEHKGYGLARGLLCWPCNRKLGNLDVEWLRKAVSYLDEAEKRNPTDLLSNIAGSSTIDDEVSSPSELAPPENGGVGVSGRD